VQVIEDWGKTKDNYEAIFTIFFKYAYETQKIKTPAALNKSVTTKSIPTLTQKD